VQPEVILSFITLCCVLLLGLYISRSNKQKEERDRKIYEVMYNEVRRASRISLECRMEVDNLAVKTAKEQQNTYQKQTEIIHMLKKILPPDDEYDLLNLTSREETAKDLLEKIRIRQQYISEAIEKLEKRL